MNPIDSSWHTFWETFATIGFTLVIIGCVIEGVEHFVKFKKGEAKKRHLIEKMGWLILIGGLAMEFLGDKKAKAIDARENARLNREAAQARDDAGKAMKQAGEANERAAKLESDNLVMEKTVRELAHLYDQSTNALAEANARLRVIKPMKERLIDFLNALDGRIIPSLTQGKKNFNGPIEAYKFNQLRDFANDPDTAKYLSIRETMEYGAGMRNGTVMTGVEITIDPVLLQK